MAKASTRDLWTKKLTGQPLGGPKITLSTLSPKKPFKGVVVGIDPSLRGTGIARIECDGRGLYTLTHSERVSVAQKFSQAEALAKIHIAVNDLLHASIIGEVAIEQTVYVQNVRIAHTLGASRGAAITAAALRGWPVHEYAPLRIKQAVVGFGRASKEQMVAIIAQFLGTKLSHDEADAAAVALCHALTRSSND